MPADEFELQTVLARAQRDGLTVRPIGAGHSFTPIAATDGISLRLDRLSGLRSVDLASGLVRLGAGTRLWELPALLGPYGLALENMGDIDTQTIAGAISTGTHGTGRRFHRHRRPGDGAASGAGRRIRRLLFGNGPPRSVRRRPDRSRSVRRSDGGDSAVRARRSCWPPMNTRNRSPRSWRTSTRSPAAQSTSSSTGSRTPTSRWSSPTDDCRATASRIACRAGGPCSTTRSPPTGSSR